MGFELQGVTDHRYNGAERKQEPDAGQTDENPGPGAQMIRAYAADSPDGAAGLAGAASVFGAAGGVDSPDDCFLRESVT